MGVLSSESLLFSAWTALIFRGVGTTYDAPMDLSQSLEAQPSLRSLWRSDSYRYRFLPGVHSPVTPEYQLPQHLDPVSALSLRLGGKDIPEGLQPRGLSSIHFLSDDMRGQGQGH